MLIYALLACTPDIRGLYEKERSAALEVASELPRDWSPDVTLDIAAPDFEAAVSTAIEAAVADGQKPIVLPLAFGVEVKVVPAFTVKEATLHPSDTCDACLAFDAELVGNAKWSVGLASGTVPLDVAAKGVFGLEVAEGHIVQAVPRSVTAVRVRVQDLGALKVNPSKAIQDQLTDELSSQIPKIRVVDLDTQKLPLRDLRLRTRGGSVRIEALSDVPGAKPVGDVEAPTEGIRLAISETALIGLARRAAFKQGELTMDVYADPLALDVQGSEFTLDLRIWRLVGRGWWRDYRVHGTLAVKGKSLSLSPTTVEELGQSPGAGLVDPLAALFEGKILEAITGSVATSLPAVQRQDLGIVQLRASPKSVAGSDGTLVLDADLLVRAPGDGKK